MSTSVTPMTVRLPDKLHQDISSIAKEQKKSTREVIEQALKAYRDTYYMKNKATIINEEILSVLKAHVELMEHRLNNKTNQVLSELAIQTAIQNLILTAELEVSGPEVDRYRKQAVDFLRTNNRVLRLDELAD